jgi:hypothetical protein
LLLRRRSFQRIRNSRPCRQLITVSKLRGYNAGTGANEEDGVKLVEEYAGVGSVKWRDRTIGAVPYRISRYQGMASSGLPIPGLHRIEGMLTLTGIADADAAAIVGASVMLDLEDGRSLALTVADEHGRVLAEGHGPRHGCSCC